MIALYTALRTGLALSAAGAVVTGVVTVTVWALRRAGAPRAVAAALWLAVLIRLVCPVGLPVAVPQPLQQAVRQTVQAVRPEALPAWDETSSGAAALQPGPTQLVTRQQTVPPPQTGRGVTGWDAAVLVWLAGAAVLMLRAGWQGLRLRRSVRFATRAEAADGTLYYQSERIPAPFVQGAVHPRICLPCGLQAAEQAAVLAHERAHLRRGDHLLRPVFYLAACLHWFNPAVWWAFAGFCRDSEAACDEAVLRTLGEAAKPDYCRTLLRFAQAHRVSPAAVAFAPDSLPARVQSILRWRQPRRSLTAVSVVLAALVFTACMAQPTSSSAVPEVETVGGQASSPAQLHTGDADTDAAAQSGAAAAPEDLVWYWPVPDYEFVSCWAEQNPLNGADHRGVDIVAPEGTPIAAAADGTVLYAGWGGEADPGALPQPLAQNGDYSGYGNLVIVEHAPGVYTLYAHCSTVAAAAGDAVTAGQTIAAMGSTGRSTGVHLHWELQMDGESVPPQQVFAAYADARK